MELHCLGVSECSWTNMGLLTFTASPVAAFPSSVGEVEAAVKPYQFKMTEIEGFRYRANVCLAHTHTFTHGHPHN